MLLKYLLTRLCIIVIGSSFLFGCIKNLPSNNIIPVVTPSTDTTDDESAAVTAIGTPSGNPVTQNIGPGGGSITSEDGRIQLMIPAGALTATTNITIQAITNECPGGIGLAYNLEPSGTKFSIPAILIFHYSQDDINGTDPQLLYTAYQDSLQQWKSDDADKEIDTVAKTVSFDINHFTIWSVLAGLTLHTDKRVLRENEYANLEVVNALKNSQWELTGGSTGIFTITNAKSVSKSSVSNWLINGSTGGNSLDGYLLPAGSSALYTAPGEIDETRTVPISVTVLKTIRVHLKKAIITELKEIKLTVYLTIIPKKLTYNVQIKYHFIGQSACFLDDYYDGATMLVVVDGDNVSIPTSSIVNQYPTVTNSPNANINVPGEICTFVPGDVGEVNITDATGTVTPTGPVQPGVERRVAVQCIQESTTYPLWEHKGPGSAFSKTGGFALPGYPQAFSFTLLDEVKDYPYDTPPNAAGLEIHG